MSALSVHVGMRVRRPALWAAGVWLVLTMGPLVLGCFEARGRTHVVAALPVLWVVLGAGAGLMAGCVHTELFSRPLAFCLPGVRRLEGLLLVGAGWGIGLVAFGVTAWAYAGRGPALVVGLGIGSVCVVCFLGVALLYLLLPAAVGALCFAAILVPMCATREEAWVSEAVEHVAADWVWLWLAMAVAGAWWAWRLITAAGLQRRTLARQSLSLLESMNPRLVREVRQRALAEALRQRDARAGVWAARSLRWLAILSPRLVRANPQQVADDVVRGMDVRTGEWAEWLLPRLAAARPGSAAHTVWSAFVMAFGSLRSSQLLWFCLLAALPMLLVYAYLPWAGGRSAGSGSGLGVLFAAPCVAGALFPLPLHNPLLLPMGRNRMFGLALSVAGGLVVLATVCTGLVCAVAIWALPLLPAVAFGGRVYEPHALGLAAWPLVLVSLPTGLLVQCLLPEGAARIYVPAVLVGMSVAAGAAYPAVTGAWLPAAAAAAVVLWAGVAAALWYHYRRRSLV